MSNDRYENIRKALAMGPTPGPWEVVGLSGYGGPYALRMPHQSGHAWYGASVKRQEDAGFIAACDPDTIRTLLAEREQLAAEIEALRERIQRDEALLRQALEALELRCGTNADERNELIPALRERIGKGEK